MRKVLLNELQLSVAILLSREEVVPRFRIISPEGGWTMFVPLPDDIGERQLCMQLLCGFMAWKSATAFVMSSELVAPDCVISAAVDRNDEWCAAADRAAPTFGRPGAMVTKAVRR